MEEHWNRVFTQSPERYGLEPSVPAKMAAQTFESLGTQHPAVLDLGVGTGRDALFFARCGMKVVALDFSAVALNVVSQAAQSLGLIQHLRTVQHNACEALPFSDSSFDACYSHMFYCMDFTLDELSRLSADVRRILKPGGIQVYTARTTADPDFGAGIYRGQQRYEDEGFVVHFFDRGMIERVARGFRILDVMEFEESTLPRRLFMVTQRKLT